jgi:PAS domain S-box-containing protein
MKSCIQMKRRNRHPLRAVAWSSREWRTLSLSLGVAVMASVIGAAINFNERLALFFRPHANLPLVQFITNFLVVWLVALLIGSYVRWRRAAIRSEELEDIIDSINPDVLLVVDRDRNILMANASVVRMFGFTLDEVIGRKTDTLYFDRRNVPDAKHEIYDVLEREGFHVGLATGRKKDDKTFPLEIITGLLRHHGGSVLLLRDVTERKEAEALLIEREGQLRQSQKMEALGLLAGGVAHDFNNLLTSILGFSDLALKSLPEGHQARDDIQQVVAGAERAAKLTAQLLAVGRKQALKIQTLELNSIVSGTVSMLKRTLGEDIMLEVKLGDDVGFVAADSGGVEQVILNLAVNARDAMLQGGTLLIQTDLVVLDDHYCRKHVGVEPGTYGRLFVRDTGCGMTQSVRERIFEPFFTTKEKGKGTGLGMSTVYGIVRQCQGYIEVNSDPGKGSEFFIFFRSMSPPPVALTGVQSPVLPGGTETVLLIEDDEAARNVAVRILESLGYNVLNVGGAKEALRICQERKASIDLILTDVVLPEINGSSLVAEARKMRHDFRAIFMTGFGSQSAIQHGLDLTRDEVVMKPYSAEELARKVRRVLDTRV